MLSGEDLYGSGDIGWSGPPRSLKRVVENAAKTADEWVPPVEPTRGGRRVYQATIDTGHTILVSAFSKWEARSVANTSATGRGRVYTPKDRLATEVVPVTELPNIPVGARVYTLGGWKEFELLRAEARKAEPGYWAPDAFAVNTVFRKSGSKD